MPKDRVKTTKNLINIISLNSLPILPNPLPDNPISASDFSLSILHSLPPMTFILFSIGPSHLSKPMLLVLKILSFINPSIRPLKHPSPVHLIVFPFPIVHFPIRPVHSPLTFDFIVVELPLVLWSVRPDKLTRTMFQAIMMLSIHKLSNYP